MEDRYEIQSKIGQGGLGAVYRAFDKRLNREVAIKRITTSSEDGLLEEATRQLSKEAGALSSLQHPNIVTVYDVGSDDDGPYVVMELIHGKTLDEVVETAPLTWEDFRELALQSQEALIGAQELELVHRDIKPGNIMLTWLPSGKFQVKIVDFGLAKLSPKPSVQTLDQAESVFGSIYFMAPEQFERAPLDMRTDMYAMGCVYYHALTGNYPFDGGCGAEVMAAHLNHTITSLADARPDLPKWACDWVMWHLNRQPDDRPANARDALQVFLQNDKQTKPEMPTPPQSEPDAPRRPKLIIPGAKPAEPVIVPDNEPPPTGPLKTKTAPQPLTPPSGSKPSVHTSSQPLPPASDPEDGAPAGQPAAEPEDANPAPAAEPAAAPPPTLLRRAAPTQQPATQSAIPSPAATAPPPVALTSISTLAPRRKGLNNPAKVAIAGVLGLLVILFGWYLMKRSAQNREIQHYNQLIQIAAPGDATEVPVNAAGLRILLNAAVDIGSNTERETVYKALFLARATDGTDIDAEIVRFVTEREMIENVRHVLITQVLRRRGSPVIIEPLLDFAAETDKEPAAIAAMQAVRRMVDDQHFDRLLSALQFTSSNEIRKAAEEAMVELLDKSSNREPLARQIHGIYQASVNDEVRHASLRLLGRTGHPEALDIAREALQSGVAKDQIAALVALASWSSDDGFAVLMDFLNTTDNDQLRTRALDSALRYATAQDAAERPSAEREEIWKQLAAAAHSSTEQDRVVRALAANDRDNWILPLVDNFAKTSEFDRVIDLAERAMDSLRERRRRGGAGEDAPADAEVDIDD